MLDWNRQRMNALMDPTELSEVSALTLSRLEQNDPTLQMLTVSKEAFKQGDDMPWDIGQYLPQCSGTKRKDNVHEY